MELIRLPPVVAEFCRSHAALRTHFADSGLGFTLDGKLVGDIAEATAAIAFGLDLCERRTPGVDAHTQCAARRSVQVKATGIRKGPAFTPGEGFADHLLFLLIDFNASTAEVAYNGPEAPIRALLPVEFTGTKRASLVKVLAANKKVLDRDRLPRIA